jgi:hypothetical protein
MSDTDDVTGIVSNLTINGETREIADEKARGDIASLQEQMTTITESIDSLTEQMVIAIRNINYLAEQTGIELPEN